MKENFDDILKRKWEQKQFPVDETHREQMLELLDKKDRRRIFPFWWFGSLVVVTALSAYFFFHQPKSSGNISPSVTNEEQALSGDNLTDQDAGQVPQSQIESDQPLPVQPSNEISSTSLSVNETSVTVKQKPLTKSNTGSEMSEPVSPKASSKSASPSKPNQSSAKSINANKTIPVAGSTNPASESVETIPGQASAEPLNTKPALANVSGNSLSPAETATGKTDALVESPADILPSAEVELRTPVQISPVETLSPSTLSYLSTLSPGPVVPEVKPDRYLSIFGEAGTGLILASQPDFSTGWKLRAGAGVAYTLQPRIQLNWSAGYLFQSGGFDFQRSSTVHQASFGARSSFNTLTPDKLHYVYTRIGGLYRFKRHFVTVHGGVQYLYGAQGEIVTQTVEQFVPGVTSNTSYDWLVTDGLQRWQWNADVAYGFQLTPRLAFSAGTDIFFSALTRKDEALSSEGYYWEGAYAPVHPFITLNYQIHALR